MDYKQLHSYQQLLLNKAYTEGIQRNEEQTKIWTQYKERHKKVIQGLEILPKELTLNCMVPIGKRAMMKGRLYHTNEILVSLGDDYFAKYSASQAIALCHRRINRAEEMLKNLESERNLLEIRQMFPLNYDAFGSGEKKDLIEHWDDTKLNEWRIQHRQREKDYRMKLAELKKEGKTEIKNEKDLFKRLDELEIEEELADEFNRLDEEHKHLFGEELQEGEVYYESEDESDSSSEEVTDKMIEEELNKLNTLKHNILNMDNIGTVEREVQNNITNQKLLQACGENENVPAASTTIEECDVKETDSLKSSIISDNSLPGNNSSTETPLIENVETNAQQLSEGTELIKTKRRVSFGESQVIEVKRLEEVRDEHENNGSDDDDDDIIIINFEHSNVEPGICENSNGVIESPRDIYNTFYKRKSILKRSPNDIRNHDTKDTEDAKEDVATGSMYSIVVKDIKERKIEQSTTNETKVGKRPVSRFRMERTNLKNLNM